MAERCPRGNLTSIKASVICRSTGRKPFGLAFSTTSVFGRISPTTPSRLTQYLFRKLWLYDSHWHPLKWLFFFCEYGTRPSSCNADHLKDSQTIPFTRSSGFSIVSSSLNKLVHHDISRHRCGILIPIAIIFTSTFCSSRYVVLWKTAYDNVQKPLLLCRCLFVNRK